MKKCIVCIVAVLLPILVLCSCNPASDSPQSFEQDLPRLADFVGVWANQDKDAYYRLTPSGTWFLYNQSGEVEDKGTVVYDGTTFSLSSENNETVLLTLGEGDTIVNKEGDVFSRVEAPSSLMSSQAYEPYFDVWFESSNLNGNTLSISEPDVWKYCDTKGNVLQEGIFYAYAGEEDVLYLYLKKDGSYFARAKLLDKDLIFESTVNQATKQTIFSVEENSTAREIYFMDKGIECNYEMGSGTRLLRNGGAAFNDSHDYKKMPVTCRIDLVEDIYHEDGTRQVKVNIIYDFYRRDLPILSGNRFYNTVRFSQYDYYTGELFSMENSEGNAALTTQWITSHDGKDYVINCSFSSNWEYSQSDDVVVRFSGTYDLVIPQDYDGFVFCLRPVFNSYSSQVSASISPEEGTLLMEDLGEDYSKSIFCRLENLYREDIAVFSFN